LNKKLLVVLCLVSVRAIAGTSETGISTAGITSQTSILIERVEPAFLTPGMTKKIRIFGGSFQPEVKIYFLETGFKVDSFYVVSSTEIVADIEIDNGVVSGKSHLEMINPAGQKAGIELPVNPLPQIISLAPADAGQGCEGQIVIIKGKNFLNGIQVWFSGKGIAVNSVSMNSPEEIAVNISVAGNAENGPRDLEIENPDQSKVASNRIFKINSGPSIKEVLPGCRSAGTFNQKIVLKGAGFWPGAKVDFGPGIRVNSTEVVSADTSQVNVDIEDSVLGKRYIVFTNPDCGRIFCKEMFFIKPRPKITKIAPQIIGTGALKQIIRIEGENFSSDCIVDIAGTGVRIAQIPVSEKEIKLEIDVSSDALPGKREMIVSNLDGGVASLKDLFEISAGPKLTRIIPLQLGQAVETDVEITGNDFAKGAIVESGYEGIMISEIQRVSANTIKTRVAVKENAQPGSVRLIVTNPDGGKGDQTFQINPKPEISNLEPAGCAQGSINQELTFTGENFQNGCQVYFRGHGINVISVTFVPPKKLIVRINLTSYATPGKHSISLVNPDLGTDKGRRIFAVYKVDRNANIFYGTSKQFTKPACIIVDKIMENEAVAEKFSKEEAKYWLKAGNFNQRLVEACQKAGKKLGYDLIGEAGFITSDGEPVDLPDITEAVAGIMKGQAKEKEDK